MFGREYVAYSQNVSALGSRGGGGAAAALGLIAWGAAAIQCKAGAVQAERCAKPMAALVISTASTASTPVHSYLPTL